MRSIFTVILLLLPLPFCLGQDDLYYIPPAKADGIPKRANTIIVLDSSDKNLIYQRVTNILLENGYGILNSDKETGTISTTEKSFKNGIIKLTILIKDNKVLFRGLYNMQMSINIGAVTSDMGWNEVACFGMKNSPNINAWNEMRKVTDQLPGLKEYFIK